MQKIMIFIIIILGVVFNLNTTFAASEYVDLSDIDKGIVKVSYSDIKNEYRILIEKDKVRLVYPFIANGKFETFPLQLGNGEYSVSLMKRIEGTKYVYIFKEKINLDLKDKNLVYLNSIQNISWSDKDKPILDATKLLTDFKTDSAKLKIIHNFIVNSIVYDYAKVSTLETTYVPNINYVYDKKKGICYDYSSLLAAILRSHGVPTKLVKGYSENVDGYHAWNEVFINNKWYIIDTTVDATSKLKIKMIKATKEYQSVNEY